MLKLCTLYNLVIPCAGVARNNPTLSGYIYPLRMFITALRHSNEMEISYMSVSGGIAE